MSDDHDDDDDTTTPPPTGQQYCPGCATLRPPDGVPVLCRRCRVAEKQTKKSTMVECVVGYVGHRAGNRVERRRFSITPQTGDMVMLDGKHWHVRQRMIPELASPNTNTLLLVGEHGFTYTEFEISEAAKRLLADRKGKPNG